MNIFKKILGLALSFLIIPCLIQAQRVSFKAQRYEELVNNTIAALQAKQKNIDIKIASSKKRSLQSAIKEKDLRKDPVRSARLNTILQGNQAVLESLEASKQSIAERLRVLRTEGNKIKNNTLGIKNRAEEELLIKKTIMAAALADTDERISQALKVEQFFEKQKSGKLPREKDALEALKRSWVQKRGQLDIKRRRQLSDLQNVK